MNYSVDSLYIVISLGILFYSGIYVHMKRNEEYYFLTFMSIDKHCDV